MAPTSSEAGSGMRACWYFGLERERLMPEAWRCVRGRHATVAALFNILGADVMAQHGYLEEVWDEGDEDPDQVEPWPVVDILDDGRVVARRVARGFRGFDFLLGSRGRRR